MCDDIEHKQPDAFLVPNGDDMRREDERRERVLDASREAIDAANSSIARSVNASMVEAYWTIGREVFREMGERAENGTSHLTPLSRRLTAEYGSGYSVADLRNMRSFYSAFPIRQTLSVELGWSHYQIVMRLEDAEARKFYVDECARSKWSVRELRHHVESQLFERLLHTREARARYDLPPAERAQVVLDQLGGIPCAESDPVLSPFKDPYVTEFLDVPNNRHVQESDLESVLIDALESFLLELDRGFAFVKRQKRMPTTGGDWWVDLVFYNIYLKRHVLFDLKVGRLEAQDVGQVDFYLNFFDDRFKLPEDEPSLGILLCSETDDTVARYSALSRNERLKTAQYFVYLPTEEELETVLKRSRVEFEERLARELPEVKADNRE